MFPVSKEKDHQFHTNSQSKSGAVEITMRLQDVVKTFPGVRALNSVSFEAKKGEVHALIGENGAGKSTLMGVAAGDLTPDSGRVEIAGECLLTFSPTASRDLGLAIVYQNPALLPDLTVAENILLALPQEIRPVPAEASRWLTDKLGFWDTKIDLESRVENISVAEQHLIEVVKALAWDPKILVFDEPTEHMDTKEVERLFRKIRELAAAGKTVIYISHRISEVKSISDRLTVLRDGAIQGTFDSGTVSTEEIVDLIVGRPVDKTFPTKLEKVDHSGDPIISVEALSGDMINNISLEIYRGEIVGLAGIEGNGQRDFLRSLAGLNPHKGRVKLNGTECSLKNTAAACKAGIAYIPRERHDEGLMETLSVGENIGLMSLARNSIFGLMRKSLEEESIDAQIKALSLRTPSLATPVKSLSGGNQQKIVIARCLMVEPLVLLADEPTQGVDAGARMEIYKILRDASNEGRAVLVASADVMELKGVCDRVFVFSRGQIIQELVGDEVTEHNITSASLSATTFRTKENGSRKVSRLRRFLGSDFAPCSILVAAILLLGIYTAILNPFYLTGRNFANMLTLLTVLAFISAGQLTVILTAGIDLSVGPLTGFAVVVASFFILDDVSTLGILIGFILSFLAAVAVGVFNFTFIRVTLITPIIATLATFMGLQGLSLLLRDIPGGLINTNVMDWISIRIGFVPVAFIVAVVVIVALEFSLRRTRWGLALRAVGSNEINSRKIGVKVEATLFSAYVLCALLTYFGAVVMMAQIGVGDARAGVTYTLMSVTAVVLGGASLFGGRGSYIGTLLGAVLVQQIFNVTAFLKLSSAWQYWLLGILTIIAAAFYSHLRRRN